MGIAAYGQGRQGITVSGYVTDSATGETLIGAGVLTPDGTGAVTNNYGYYSLTIPRGRTELRYCFVGYGDVVTEASFSRDTVIHVVLQPSEELEAATVVAQKDAGIHSTYLGAIDVPVKQIQFTPVIFGESDVLKSLQMLPGVQGGNEGFTGLYVRGGGPDENLIMLDGVPIYNVDHLMGLFSVFQTEAVKKVTLYKGSFPARYSGRVSSIVDIRTNDGNMKETSGSATLGVVTDKFHIEGPILKDRLSYSFSARGMHTAVFDPLIRMAMPKDQYVNYYFYDLNGKLSWRLSDNDRFFLGFYSGADKFRLKYKEDSSGTGMIEDQPYTYSSFERDDMGIRWGNDVVSLRWNHIFSPRLFANSTVSWNRYRMSMTTVSHERGHNAYEQYDYRYDVGYHSGIRDWSAKIDFDFVPTPRHLVKFGAQYIYHTFRPETLTAITDETSNGENNQNTFKFKARDDYYGHDISVYGEDDFTVGERLTVNPGVNISLFATEGKLYPAIQPRLSAKYVFDRGFSAKAGYARMAQYVHLLSASQISLPVDLWVPITKNIRPVTSDQFSVGAYYSGLKDWEFSLEAYWKEIDNILEYKDGTLMFASSGNWEDKVEMGQARARGIEFMAQKTAGRLTGWLAYTLAKSDRRFPDGSINLGKTFPYKYDRRHSLNLSLNYALTRRLEFNAAWVFSTGGTVTIPVRKTAVLYPDSDRPVSADYIVNRNNYRLPSTHHLDLGLLMKFPHRNGTEGLLNLTVYNAYNHRNPNFCYFEFEYDYDKSGNLKERRLVMHKISILPILPSLSYTLNF